VAEGEAAAQLTPPTKGRRRPGGGIPKTQPGTVMKARPIGTYARGYMADLGGEKRAWRGLPVKVELAPLL